MFCLLRPGRQAGVLPHASSLSPCFFSSPSSLVLSSLRPKIFSGVCHLTVLPPCPTLSSPTHGDSLPAKIWSREFLFDAARQDETRPFITEGPVHSSFPEPFSNLPLRISFQPRPALLSNHIMSLVPGIFPSFFFRLVASLSPKAHFSSFPCC